MQTNQSECYTTITARSNKSKQCDNEQDDSDEDKSDRQRLNQWLDVNIIDATVFIALFTRVVELIWHS